MDMGKTGYITARVEPKLKARAARVLATVGVSTTDASTMFLRQVGRRIGIPIEVRVDDGEAVSADGVMDSASRRMMEGRCGVWRPSVPRATPTVRPDLRRPSNRERAMGPLVAAGAAMAPLIANRLAGMLPGTAPGQFRFAALAAACWQAS